MALTRAKKRIYLVNTYERYLYGRKSNNEASRFLEEIPSELCTEFKRPGFFETTKAVFGGASTSRSFAGGSGAIVKEGCVPFRVQTGEPPQGQGYGQIFGLGDKVFHQKWGEGVIVGTKGQGSEIELTIAFPAQGLKTVIAKYAPLKKLR